MRSKALFAPRPALAKRAARGTRNKRRPVSKNRKVGTVDRDPRTARRYAPNERRRPRDARLQRETASSRVGARLSAAARAGNAACASRRRLEGGWSREENASGAITPSTDWQVPLPLPEVLDVVVNTMVQFRGAFCTGDFISLKFRENARQATRRDPTTGRLRPLEGRACPTHTARDRSLAVSFL